MNRDVVPADIKRAVLVEAGHRCAIPTCKATTTEIAHIVPWAESQDNSFENLIALCPNCHTRFDQKKEIDRTAVKMYKHNLGILNNQYGGKVDRRIEELEQRQRPRTISLEQKAAFVEATKAGPFGPVVLVTRTALPNKEQEDFTMQLRKMLDEAGFGNEGSDIVNGFSTGADPKQFLGFVLRGNTQPLYFSNLAGGLHKIGLISPDVPVAVNNPNAKNGVLYLFIPEK